MLDWQVVEAETTKAYGLLFQSLNDRGLEEVPLIVAAGCMGWTFAAPAPPAPGLLVDL